jgi:hypothetical protein
MPMPLAEALTNLAKDLQVQKLVDRKAGLFQMPNIVFYFPGRNKFVFPEVTERAVKLQNFFKELGAQVHTSLPLPDGFGSSPRDRFVICGIEVPDAEATRLAALDVLKGKVIPVILQGTVATSFPRFDFGNILMLDFAGKPSNLQVKELMKCLFDWDVDDHPDFAAAIDLFHARVRSTLCHVCEKRDTIRYRPATRKCVEGVAVNVKDEFVELQELVPGSGAITLEEFFALTADDLEDLVKSVDVLKRGKVRLLILKLKTRPSFVNFANK